MISFKFIRKIDDDGLKLAIKFFITAQVGVPGGELVTPFAELKQAEQAKIFGYFIHFYGLQVTELLLECIFNCFLSNSNLVLALFNPVIKDLDVNVMVFNRCPNSC